MHECTNYYYKIKGDYYFHSSQIHSNIRVKLKLKFKLFPLMTMHCVLKKSREIK